MTELYRHYDKDGVLLYVGISLSAAIRLTAHRRQSEWFGAIRTIKIARFRSLEAAREAERVAIRDEHPMWNISGTAPERVKPRRKRPQPRQRLYSPKVEEAYQELLANLAKNISDEVTP